MCTGIRFNSSDGEMYFGRNLDWTTSYGEKIVITPRGFNYKSAYGFAEKTEVEAAKQAPAVIGMGIVVEGVPLYFDCANEDGLCVAGLNFPGYAAYAKAPVEGKTNIAAYEFPLWVARSFKTVDEVIEALKGAAIVAKPINDKFPVSELHWIIGDKKRSIVVEYTERGMEVFENPVDVLTNQPGYNWHAENLRNYMNIFPQMPAEVRWREARLKPFGSGSLMNGLPGGYSPADRFVRVSYLNTHYPVKDSEEENISRLFHTLSGVAMIEGGASMADGAYEKTIYTGGYSTRTKTYYYNTYENPAIVSVSMNDENLDSSELIVK